MTCTEKFNKERPGTDKFLCCPSDVGYLDDPEWCNDESSNMGCRECWDREMGEEAELKFEHSGQPIAQVTNIVEEVDGITVHIEPIIKDSGDRTHFESGAVRDMREGKGRCDLMPLEVVANYISDADQETDYVLWSIREFQKTNLTRHLYCALNSFDERCWDNCYTMMLETAKHYEEGAKKYGENNWQKGIPAWCYIDSAIRHYLKWLRGDTDEPHDRAFVWNLLCCIWEVDFREKEE